MECMPYITANELEYQDMCTVVPEQNPQGWPLEQHPSACADFVPK
jgi:hypothetical protein